MAERVKGFGYDLDAAVSGTEGTIVMVDIGGGKGKMLLEVKNAYPDLPSDSLVLEDHCTGNASARA